MPKITQVPSVPVPSNKQSNIIRWRDWSLGENTEDDPRDLPLGANALVQNFEIDKRGKLVDINGHTSVLSNIPASLSISRVFQYKVTKPSVQTITIVIGTLSGLAKVYAVNTTLFARPGDSNGWRDLTQYVYADTLAGTGTTTTTTDLGALSQAADAQKGYLIINTSTAISSIITASSYSAGVWTLTTTDSLAGSPGDTVLVMRYSLIGYFSTGAVTDYDLSISDANDVSFTLDNENLRINFGSDNDQSRGFWFGYIDRYLLDGNQNSDTSTPNGYNHGGWICENQEMQRISPLCWSGVITAPTNADPLPADDYTLRASYMYDGNQEGPLMDYDASVLGVTVATGQVVGVELTQFLYTELPNAGSSPPMLYRNGADINGYTMFMSHRITDLNLYLSNDNINYYLVDSFVLSADSSTPTLNPTGTQLVTGVKWTARGGEYADRTGFGSYPYIEEDTPTKAMGFCGSQTIVRGRRIIGDMRQPSPEDFEPYVFRIAAAMPHSNGTFNNDVFGLSLSEHIDIRTKQADGVMGLEELNGGLAVIKEHSLHMIDFGGGRMESWRIAKTNDSIGAISKRSIVRIPRGIIFAGEDNIFLFDGVNTTPIADSWKSDYQAISTVAKTSMVGAYYSKRKQYRLYDPNSRITYVYNIRENSWVRNTSIDAQPVDMYDTPDGDIVWVSASQAYKMDDSSGVNTIRGDVLTSIKDLGGEATWRIKEIHLIAKGTGTATVVLYGGNGGTTLGSETFTLSSSVTRYVSRVSEVADDIQVKVFTNSNNSYDTEIHEVAIVSVPMRKIRAAI